MRPTTGGLQSWNFLSLRFSSSLQLLSMRLYVKFCLYAYRCGLPGVQVPMPDRLAPWTDDLGFFHCWQDRF